MNPQLQRGLMLYQQGRHEQAEAELRQALTQESQDFYGHALLALCLCEQKKFQPATEEARQAIHLGPDFAFAHYALACVLSERQRPDEALDAINEALRLEPEDADYCALLGRVRLEQRNWRAALEAAERGLQCDAEHVACANLRAIALVKLGRQAEAGATIDAALARNPDNSVTHANRGWACLESRDPAKALEHFREALRLDPTNEWAQAGIVEALKARNVIYGLMLRYFLWISKLSSGAQWGLILGGYFLNQMLSGLARGHPDLAPWVLPVRIVYLAFVLLTWTADPLFNLLLRMNRFGRLALSREQMTASTWFGMTLILALLSVALCSVFGFDSVYLLAALVFGILLIPVAGTFRAHEGWPRNVLAGYTSLLALIGIGSLALLAVGEWPGMDRGRFMRGAGGLLFGVFLLGSIAFMWGANLIIRTRPKK
jgi:tetratricopeptide (TPR) repeat protein